MIIQKLIKYNSNCSIDEQMEERTLKYFLRNIMLKNKPYMCMRTPCGAGIDTLAFRSDGGIFICDNFINESKFKLGNIHTDSLDYILENNDFIKHLKSKLIDDLPSCSACTLRKLCDGICMAHTCFEIKNENIINPECHFRQLIIPYLIELLSEGILLPNNIDRKWPLSPLAH
jgi:radical SAM protein with 4Fe4S-binding SPASM domain